MTDTERLRRHLAAAGATIPDELLEIVAAMVGSMLGAHERLPELGDIEPFCPARRLVDDAA